MGPPGPYRLSRGIPPPGLHGRGLVRLAPVSRGVRRPQAPEINDELYDGGLLRRRRVCAADGACGRPC